MNLNCALELVEFVESIYGFNKNKIGKMEDEREKEDETLFQKYFEEKEIEFMFPPETASEMQHQRNINIAKVSNKVYHYVIVIDLTIT